jgi:hypothetical protein
LFSDVVFYLRVVENLSEVETELRVEFEKLTEEKFEFDGEFTGGDVLVISEFDFLFYYGWVVVIFFIRIDVQLSNTNSEGELSRSHLKQQNSYAPYLSLFIILPPINKFRWQVSTIMGPCPILQIATPVALF